MTADVRVVQLLARYPWIQMLFTEIWHYDLEPSTAKSARRDFLNCHQIGCQIQAFIPTLEILVSLCQVCHVASSLVEFNSVRVDRIHQFVHLLIFGLGEGVRVTRGTSLDWLIVP